MTRVMYKADTSAQARQGLELGYDSADNENENSIKPIAKDDSINQPDVWGDRV